MKYLVLVFTFFFASFGYSQIEEEIIIHKVEKGETLYKLSVLYGAPIDSIKKWNALETEELHIDQEVGIFNVNHYDKYKIEANKLRYKVDLLEKEIKKNNDLFDTYFSKLEEKKNKIDPNSEFAMQQYMSISKENKELKDSLKLANGNNELLRKIYLEDIQSFEQASLKYQQNIQEQAKLNAKNELEEEEETVEEDAEQTTQEVSIKQPEIAPQGKEEKVKAEKQVKEPKVEKEKIILEPVKTQNNKEATTTKKEKEQKEEVKITSNNKDNKKETNAVKDEKEKSTDNQKANKKEADTSKEDIVIVDVVDQEEPQDTVSKKYLKKQEKLQRKLDAELDSSELKGKFVVDEVQITDAKKKKYKIGDEVDATRREKAKFLLARAMLEIDKYNFKKAYEYVNKSISLNPSYTEAYLIKGDLLASMKYYDKAIIQYEHATFLDDRNPQTFYNMGNCFMILGKKEKAISNFTQSVTIDSSYIMAYMGRSAIFSEQKKFTEALADYNKILKLNKYFYPALKGRGMAFSELAQYDNAIRDFNELLEYEKNDPSIYYLRGMAKMYKSMIYEACLDFLSASEQGYAEADKAIKKYCE